MKKHLKIFSIFCLMMLLIITGCTNSKKMYTIRFNTSGGSSINALRYKENELLNLPADPVKQGYEFDGWYLDKDYNLPLELPFKVTKSLTLFAKWDKITYGNLIDIKLDTSLVKTTYNALETFDISNLKITEIYDSGDNKVIDHPLVTVDKTVLHGNDTKVIVTYGKISKEILISVNKLDYDLSNISFESDAKEYSGKEESLTFTGVLPNGLLASVVGSIKNVGNETITLEFTNLNEVDYNTPSNLTATLTITPKELEDTMFEKLNDATYNGNYHEPNVFGKYQDTALILNTDFLVSYHDNLNAGTGKVVIKGINNFKGEVTKTFNIVLDHTDLDKVIEGIKALENTYGDVLKNVLNKVPNKLATINSNGTINQWFSSTTAFSVDTNGIVSAIYKAEEQDVILTVVVRSGDNVGYLQFNFKLPKLVTKVDTTTLIEVDNVVDGVNLEVKELTESETTNIVIMENEKLLKAYNINLLDDTLQKVELATTVTVKIPLPSDLGENTNLTVYYVSENGTLENMNATKENDYLVFTTNHFSIYIVTMEKEENIKGTKDNPYTVSEALEKIGEGSLTDVVYVKGTITSIEEINLEFGNATFNLDSLKCYRLKNVDDTVFSKANDLLVGDSVIVYGKLTDFYGTKEVTNGYISSINKVPRNTYTVNLEKTEYGTPTLSSTSVEHGLSVTLTFNPLDGYEVSIIKVNDAEISVSGTSINLVITENTVISVIYKEKVQTSTLDVAFDFTSQGYSNAEVVTDITKNDVTIKFNKGTNKNNEPKYYTSGTAIGIYGGNTFTITSEKNIINIKLTFSTGENTNEITTSNGTFNTDTWVGNEKSVTFTVSGTSGQRRVKSLVVTIIDDGSSVTPNKYQVTFNSNGGSEVLTQEVEEGSKASKPANPIREGYNFISWQLDGVDYDFTKQVTKNITLNATWEAAESVDILYELVTSVSQLKVGSKVIIVHKENGKNKALGITQKSNNRASTEINFIDELVKQNDDIAIIEICEGKLEGTFALKVTNGTSTGYLYAASSSNNYLRTETTLSNNSSWTITIDGKGNTTIIAQGSNTNNVMRYNLSSDLFACYAKDKASNQTDIQLYIKSDNNLTDEEIVKKEISLFTINSSLSNGYSLPTSGKLGSKIVWNIDKNHTSSLQNGKLVNDTNEDLSVTIYAKFTYGNYTSEEQAYNVTIRKTLTSSDVDAYYDEIVATSGEALKEELRDLLTSTHTKITSYDDCKIYLQEADEDPNNSDNMLLFYTGTSITKTANMSIWNREHVWCQSLGWFSTSGAGADLHHIRPCNTSVNSSRGNKKFGVSSGYYTPSDEYKGDVARIIFYLMVRYSEADYYDFTAIAESLDILLEWNVLDPVSETEIIRNNYIYTIQGNRNPFIDNSDYAQMIWG